MKKQLLVSGFLALVVSVGLPAVTSGELDLPGLNQRIDNLDARTTNLESDVGQLQAATGTPAAEHVPVPAPAVTPASEPVVSPAVTPQPTPAPTVSLIFVEHIQTNAGPAIRYRCSYSDGQAKTFTVADEGQAVSCPEVP